jgi:drug/metabolite transporter (DMT)-like permease
MAVCCTIGGHSVYSWGLKFLPASFVASAKMMEPVFASVWALFLFGEKPGILVILGGAVVILGIVIYGRISGEEG